MLGGHKSAAGALPCRILSGNPEGPVDGHATAAPHGHAIHPRNLNRERTDR